MRRRYRAQAPYNRIVHSTTRTWRDANTNFIPECDLTSPLANGECGALADPNFGKAAVSTTYDPGAITGWGKRPFDWEFATSVQQQILPRVSVEAGYFRRWYGNFGLTDNVALTAADFDSYCITAPADGRLPDAGGSQICGLYNVTPTKFSVAAQNFVTSASNYGKQIEHWNGVDFSVNARLAQGFTLQGGVSTGRTSTDNCAIVSQHPELLTTATTAVPLGYCHVDSLFLTQVKGISSYTIPKVDIQLGGSFQSNPGPLVQATYNAPNSAVSPSLGRVLSGGQQNVQVNLLTSNAVATALGTASAGLLYESTAYVNFRQPQIVMVARFVKVSAQLDF